MRLLLSAILYLTVSYGPPLNCPSFAPCLPPASVYTVYLPVASGAASGPGWAALP
jgi:hypothetical protein